MHFTFIGGFSVQLSSLKSVF